jgi:hypothetical protein
MKKLISVLLITVMCVSFVWGQDADTSESEENPIRFTIQLGYPLYLAGYFEEEIGDGESPDPDEESFTEYISNPYHMNLSLGVGQQLLPELSWAFRMGIWSNIEFSRAAYTTGSINLTYMPFHLQIDPLISFTGGLYQTWTQDLGFYINPGAGVKLQNGDGTGAYITVGYLMTFYAADGVDPGGSGYYHAREEMMHHLTFDAGCIF